MIILSRYEAMASRSQLVDLAGYLHSPSCGEDTELEQLVCEIRKVRPDFRISDDQYDTLITASGTTDPVVGGEDNTFVVRVLCARAVEVEGDQPDPEKYPGVYPTTENTTAAQVYLNVVGNAYTSYPRDVMWVANTIQELNSPPMGYKPGYLVPSNLVAPLEFTATTCRKRDAPEMEFPSMLAKKLAPREEDNPPRLIEFENAPPEYMERAAIPCEHNVPPLFTAVPWDGYQWGGYIPAPGQDFARDVATGGGYAAATLWGDDWLGTSVSF